LLHRIPATVQQLHDSGLVACLRSRKPDLQARKKDNDKYRRNNVRTRAHLDCDSVISHSHLAAKERRNSGMIRLSSFLS
jgi:hypothetical protein